MALFDGASLSSYSSVFLSSSRSDWQHHFLLLCTGYCVIIIQRLRVANSIGRVSGGESKGSDIHEKRGNPELSNPSSGISAPHCAVSLSSSSSTDFRCLSNPIITSNVLGLLLVMLVCGSSLRCACFTRKRPTIKLLLCLSLSLFSRFYFSSSPTHGGLIPSQRTSGFSCHPSLSLTHNRSVGLPCPLASGLYSPVNAAAVTPPPPQPHSLLHSKALDILLITTMAAERILLDRIKCCNHSYSIKPE